MQILKKALAEGGVGVMGQFLHKFREQSYPAIVVGARRTMPLLWGSPYFGGTPTLAESTKRTA